MKTLQGKVLTKFATDNEIGEDMTRTLPRNVLVIFGTDNLISGDIVSKSPRHVLAISEQLKKSIIND